MAILGIIYIAIAWLWVQHLPGYFVSRALVPEARGMERHGLALICGFSLVPLLVFLLTVAAGIPFDAPMCWIVASAVNIGGAFIIVPPSQWKTPDIDLKSTLVLLGAAAAVGLFLLFGLRSLDGGDVFSTVHHCLYVIVMHTIANDASVSVPLYDWLSGGMIHYLVNHPTTEFNGLAPLFFEQRLGNAPILAPAVALFGSAGWYVTTVYASMVTGVCVWLAARELNARPAAATISAAVFVYGMHIFLAYFVNENLYAVALVSFLVWAALRKELSMSWVVIIGIVCGHLVGVRYTSSLFWPAAAAMVWWQHASLSHRAKQVALGSVLAILFLLPWLYVNFLMLGDMVTHPKIHAEFAGRIVENNLMGWSFEFRALNWPFIDQLSRTAWNPFPTFLWLPLWCGLCFGQLSMALGVVGLWQLRTEKRALVLLLLFAVPHSIAITLLESLDWEQLTYAAPGLVPLAPLMAVGMSGLWDGAKRKRQAAIVAGTLVAIMAASMALRATDFPVDTRILPKKSQTETLREDRGTESVSSLLTSPHPLPRLPVLRTTFAGSMWGAFAHVFSDGGASTIKNLPAYPTDTVAVLAGYAAEPFTSYRFVVEGGPLRQPEDAVRSSLGLHLVTLKLPANHVEFIVERAQGEYRIEVTPLDEIATEKDFSIWLHPWFPPVKRVAVSLNGRPPASMRTLKYGGTQEDGEERFISTNYPSKTLDVISVPYTVDANGEALTCGLFLFTNSVDPTSIETLVLAGGHDQSWHGTASGTITIPRNILADRVVLYSEPYCSDHVPQYGDRYSVIEAPFSPDKPLEFKLSEMW